MCLLPSERGLVNGWGEETFSFERRRFWWGRANVAAGWVWSLYEVSGSAHHPIIYHGREVLLRVQPDLEPGRWYWWADFAAYKPPRRMKNPKPERPHVQKWGTCATIEEARHAAFAAFVAYRHTRDVVNIEQVSMGL